MHDPAETEVNDLRSVHLWFCDLDREPSDAAVAVLLSAAERARATRLKRELDRNRYVAGRAFVRRVLSGLLDQSADSLRFETGRCGRPRLPPDEDSTGRPRPIVNFSVSYSGQVLGLAATGREVGLDIELARPIPDLRAVAADQFEPGVLDLILRQPPHRQLTSFYRHWTAREAVAKLQGRGIDCRHRHEPLPITHWTVQWFEYQDGQEGLVGAVALDDLACARAWGAADPPTPSALPSPSAGAPCSRTSGSAWPAARSARSTACRSS